MALSQTSVLKLYNTVIDDVIAGVRDAFLDEGVDEQVLQEMKQVWTNKLLASKSVELTPDPPEPQPPPIVANNTKSSSSGKANGTKSKSRPHQQAQHQQQQLQQQQQQQQQQQNNQNNHLSLDNSANNNSFQNQIVNGSQKLQDQINQQQQSQQQQQQQQQQQSAQQQQTPQLPQPLPPPPPMVANLDPNKIVPIQITLPSQPGSNGGQRVLTIQVPASALQENQLHTVLTGPVITSIMQLPPNLASSVLQQHVTSALQNQSMVAVSNSISIQKQVDGAGDSSDDDASDGTNTIQEDEEAEEEEDDEADGEGGLDEEPLNSDDDVSEEEQADLFDTDNVVVCQYDKITRSRNKWKFYLKDGIMNIGGKDYVFQKSNGDAEW